jgi:O-antigen/teichoic acid export membrane protein
MRSLISRVLKKDIIKVFSLNAVSTLIRMLTAFVSVKVVAVLIGPSGIALLGQLNNFSSIFLTVASGGINSGTTKYVAEHAKSPNKIKLFLKTAFWITSMLSVISGLALMIGSSYFSMIILKDAQYASILVVFGSTLIFYSFNGLLLSVLNGFKEFKKFVTINILGSLVGLLFSCVLALYFGIYGALLSAVTYQSIVFFVTLSVAFKCTWFKKDNFIGKFSKTAGRKLAHYSLMALVSAATVPVSQLIIRSYIVQHTSLNDAGVWEGMNRISAMYLMVVTSSLSIYYLPRLAEINTDNELKHEILNTFKIILPAVIFISFSIFFLRSFIIHLLFNEKFNGMQNLFAFQLIGDLFKISSWILAYQMVAKSMTKTYVVSEFLFSALFVGLSMVFVKLYGNMGATIGYAITYFLYFLSMLFIFRKLIFRKVQVWN